MSFINEKNIPKIIVYTSLVVMISMTIFISLLYVKNRANNFETEMKKYEEANYENHKIMLKNKINTVTEILNYFAKKEKNQKKIKEQSIDLIKSIKHKEEGHYIFVYEIEDINGGDNFAKMLINPNMKELVGKFISTNSKDSMGYKFREVFLKDIKFFGESFIKYRAKNPITKQYEEKLSYFKYFPKWNWVVATGVYINEVEDAIEVKREFFEKGVQGQVIQNIIVLILFLIFEIIVFVFLSEKISSVLKRNRESVKLKSRELQELNDTLSLMVKDEVEKNREKEQFLIQKSKFIALGEMISNIAHQWRQPLSELSSILMSIEFKYSMNKLDSKQMAQKVSEANLVIEFMSHTIEDFRNFFLPKKKKKLFSILKAINATMRIVSSALKNNNIKINIDVEKDIKIDSYKNELEQVLLNIITNAKDSLIKSNLKNPTIIIRAYQIENYVKILIENNGKKIDKKIFEKIFDPYFTTKEQDEGTGIGLYMSKIIIEKNMKGNLGVRNSRNGVIFEINIPKS